ncbi:hypothetical protein TBLA_0D04650 [Henningerozyma blattae CBS 6284]|uniref:Uncharacterized protein n=1 Tax=Henningerozyma blattae (strain ATCC 34711 / CBS 6284 / DSM 70876 / NBRC 10599 / NRRL Y-10934 / UCD 77-7) TaxID=1071380 RepID=I2H3K9_HENB6|nr:hypothetical protein TBLA_0D04650 [Tetrapisispora blattae CBS 6284]CCH60961.1 hypothetical protein TBLA_0D04650 [Tetrapisispora blattae CBS 6284]
MLRRPPTQLQLESQDIQELLAELEADKRENLALKQQEKEAQRQIQRDIELQVQQHQEDSSMDASVQSSPLDNRKPHGVSGPTASSGNNPQQLQLQPPNNNPFY